MTDEDLYLLLDEEMRLYYTYTQAMSEEARYPKRVAKKRQAWVDLYQKLRPVVSPEKRRELLQRRVEAAAIERKRKR